MGKSTTANLFAKEGCAVWDADAAVHRLYAPGGLAVAPIAAAVPGAIENGGVSREALKRMISADVSVLKTLEQIVHPLVRQDRADFAQTASADVLVFDIPLLFETGSESEFDAVACVSVDPETQRSRVLDRGTMTAEQFETILAKQMPISEKCARADFVIETDTPDHARVQVREILGRIRKAQTDA